MTYLNRLTATQKRLPSLNFHCRESWDRQPRDTGAFVAEVAKTSDEKTSIFTGIVHPAAC